MTAMTATQPGMFKKTARTPKNQIKTIYWRGDVIDVLNSLFPYEIVDRPHDPSQAWFWTGPWQESLERSLEQINAGQGTVHTSGDDFLAALAG
jgi:hypothetical protein